MHHISKLEYREFAGEYFNNQSFMKLKARKITGKVVSGTDRKKYKKTNGDLSEKCKLHVRSLPTEEGVVEELAITCSGELANYFYYRGMVEVEYVVRVYSPDTNVLINDAYALNIRVV